MIPEKGSAVKSYGSNVVGHLVDELFALEILIVMMLETDSINQRELRKCSVIVEKCRDIVLYIP